MDCNCADQIEMTFETFNGERKDVLKQILQHHRVRELSGRILQQW